MYSLLPVYTDYNVEVFPLSNPLYAAYNRDVIFLSSRTQKENIDLPLVAKEITKESKEMIERKIAKHQRIPTIQIKNLNSYIIINK